MFKGLAPWLERLPGRLLHTNVIGCTIFAAVSGSSRRDLRDHRQDDAARAAARAAIPDDITIGTLAGAGTLGPADPAVDHHDRLRRHAPTSRSRSCSSPASSRASCWRGSSRATSSSGRCCNPTGSRRPTERMTLRAEAARVAAPDPGGAADRRRAGLDLRRHRHRHRGRGVRRRRLARHLGGAGLAELARPSATACMGATRLYCMIALILAGAAFLTLAMGYIGLPRHLAEWIATLGLSPFALIVALTRVLHRARLLPRRHLDGRADDGRDPADGRRRPASTCSGSASSSCSSSRWRRSRRRSASTCSCCRA